MLLQVDIANVVKGSCKKQRQNDDNNCSLRKHGSISLASFMNVTPVVHYAKSYRPFELFVNENYKL